MGQLIRVLIADDHAIVRKGLRSLLTAKYGIMVVGEADNGNDAVAMACELRPDVILMDLMMPGADGIEATRAIQRREPGARILIVTSFSEEKQIIAAIQAGAIGYILKDAAPDELIHAIHGAHMGKTSLSAYMLQFMLSDSRGLDLDPPIDSSTADGLLD